MLRRIGSHTVRRSAATLPELKYQYHELEPFINGNIMEIHHTKHHQTYINNFNNLSAQLSDLAAEGNYTKHAQMQPALNFNYGGYVNHCLFWDNLCPEKDSGHPEGALAKKIDEDFGGFDKLKAELTAKSVGVMGSGWGWLGYDQASGKLKVATTANQDMLEVQTGLKPLIGIDVWEHAYYLQYKNVRPDYVNQVWNVLNWEEIGNRFNAVQ